MIRNYLYYFLTIFVAVAIISTPADANNKSEQHEQQKESIQFIKRGQKLFGQFCFACHGQNAEGGLPNPNAVKSTIPGLDSMAERLMIYEPDEAEYFIDYLEMTRSLEIVSADLKLPRAHVTAAQLKAVGDVIANGNLSGKIDPEGVTPISMPPWKMVLKENDILSIIAFLSSKYQWDE